MNRPNVSHVEQLLRSCFAPTQPLYPVLMPRRVGPPAGTIFNRIERGLINSGSALTTLSVLPADLRSLRGDELLRLNGQLLARHAIVFFFAEDFDDEILNALSLFPFLVGFDLRGDSCPRPASPPGHLWSELHDPDPVLSYWRSVAEEAVERVAAHWPAGTMEFLRELAQCLTAGGGMLPLREVKHLEAWRYLQPNGIVRNVAAGFWGSQSCTAGPHRENPNDLDLAQRVQCELAEEIVALRKEREHADPQPDAILIAPAVNPTYVRGLGAPIHELGGPRATMDRLTELHGYNFPVLGDSERENEVLMGLVRERGREIFFHDLVATIRATPRLDTVFRTPYLPGTLYDQLERFSNLKWDQSNLAKINRRFVDYGNLLSDLMGRDRLKWIATNTRRVLALADLPVEWAMIDGVPLGAMLRVARLPLAPGNAPVRALVDVRPPSLWRSIETVRVLFVSGHLPSDPLASFPRQLADLVEKVGFPVAFEEVRSEAGFLEALEKHKPNLLYISTHGSVIPDEGTAICFGEQKSLLRFDGLPHAPEAAIISACGSDSIVRTYGTPASRLYLSGVRAVLGSYVTLTEPHASGVAEQIFGTLVEVLRDPESTASWQDVVFMGLRRSQATDIVLSAAQWARRRGKVFPDPELLYQRLGKSLSDDEPKSYAELTREVPRRLVDLARGTPFESPIASVVTRGLYRPESWFYTHIGEPERVLIGKRWSELVVVA